MRKSLNLCSLTSNSKHTNFVATMCLNLFIKISISTVIVQPFLHLLTFIYSPYRKASILHAQAAHWGSIAVGTVYTNGLAAFQNVVTAITSCHLMLTLILRGLTCSEIRPCPWGNQMQAWGMWVWDDLLKLKGIGGEGGSGEVTFRFTVMWRPKKNFWRNRIQYPMVF